jgi:putative transposase
MPRRARLAIPGIPWHIIQRGNNRSVCFYTEEDYRKYLDTLREQAMKYGCAIHAYVLMTNHVHLLLTPEKADSAALLMKHLGQRYVQYINRVYRRSGTLWEGRFRSCLTQSEDYVLACYRYIELNPVRANMVSHPREYPWSSYRANGEDVADPLLTPHDEYLRLGRSGEERRHHYRELFKAHMDPERINEIRRATNGNYALGNERFKTEIEQALRRRATPGRSGRPAREVRADG